MSNWPCVNSCLLYIAGNPSDSLPPSLRDLSLQETGMFIFGLPRYSMCFMVLFLSFFVNCRCRE